MQGSHLSKKQLLHLQQSFEMKDLMDIDIINPNLPYQSFIPEKSLDDIIHQIEYQNQLKLLFTKTYQNQHNIKHVQKYRSYSIQFKNELVKQMREQAKSQGLKMNEIIHEKAKQLKISPRNLSRWSQMKEIKKYNNSGKKPQFPLMESILVEHLNLFPKTSIQEAKDKASELCQLVYGKSQNVDSFSFSLGWLSRFRKRRSQQLQWTPPRGKRKQHKSDQLKEQHSDQYTIFEEDQQHQSSNQLSLIDT